MKNILKYTALCLAVVYALSGIAINVILFANLENITSIIDGMIVHEVEPEEFHEDDVTIGEAYVIRSTLPISDAFKSGDRSALNDKEKETLDMASKVLSEITTSGMSDYEKELAVYRWMTSELQFDRGSLLVIPKTNADCDNPYGVLKYHNAVCVGYATTFRLFMQMMNIECKIVHDTYFSHSWDLVKLGDSWYHTDIYFDAGDTDYSCFNMNDYQRSTSYNWETEYYPAALGYEYSYAYINRQSCDNVYTLPTLLRTAINDRNPVLSLDFGSDVSDRVGIIVSYMMSTIQDTLSCSIECGNLGIEWSWMSAGSDYVLCIYINGLGISSDDSSELTEEELMNAFASIDEAFYDLTDGWC